MVCLAVRGLVPLSPQYVDARQHLGARLQQGPRPALGKAERLLSRLCSLRDRSPGPAQVRGVRAGVQSAEGPLAPLPCKLLVEAWRLISL